MTRPPAPDIVIGGGPAGIAAALELARAGRSVTLLEREGALGGAPRHCAHSPFGMLEFGRPYLGPAYARKLAATAARAGIDIRLRHSVTSLGPDGRLEIAHPGGTESWTADRVLLATGARDMPRSARLLPGDRAGGILTTGTLQAMVTLEGLRPFRRPVILGTELVSFSALMTCLGHGMRPVAMLGEEAAPLARWPSGLAPRALGVPLHLGVTITGICAEAGTLRSVSFRKDGRETTLDCDGLILTGRFVPEAALLLNGATGIDPASQGPGIDQFGRLGDPACFAAGNLLRGVETGGRAFREGRALGRMLAAEAPPEGDGPDIPVHLDGPLRLALPQRLRRTAHPGLHRQFQIRVSAPVRGRLCLMADGREIWSRRAMFRPERRILAPILPEMTRAGAVTIRLEEER